MENLAEAGRQSRFGRPRRDFPYFLGLGDIFHMLRGGTQYILYFRVRPQDRFSTGLYPKSPDHPYSWKSENFTVNMSAYLSSYCMCKYDFCGVPFIYLIFIYESFGVPFLDILNTTVVAYLYFKKHSIEMKIFSEI